MAHEWAMALYVQCSGKALREASSPKIELMKPIKDFGIGLSIVSGIALLLYTCTNPFWPTYFLPRPMFRIWGGGQSPGWDTAVFFRDSFGTWIYEDKELNIVVAATAINDPDAGQPLRKASSSNAVFNMDGMEVTIQASDKDKLFILDGTGIKAEIQLQSGESSAIIDMLHNAPADKAKSNVELILKFVQRDNGK